MNEVIFQQLLSADILNQCFITFVQERHRAFIKVSQTFLFSTPTLTSTHQHHMITHMTGTFHTLGFLILSLYQQVYSLSRTFCFCPSHSPSPKPNVEVDLSQQEVMQPNSEDQMVCWRLQSKKNQRAGIGRAGVGPHPRSPFSPSLTGLITRENMILNSDFNQLE